MQSVLNTALKFSSGSTTCGQLSLAGETQALTKLQDELLPIERHEVRQDAETVVLAFVHSMKYIRSSKSAGLQEVVCALVLGLRNVRVEERQTNCRIVIAEM